MREAPAPVQNPWNMPKFPTNEGFPMHMNLPGLTLVAALAAFPALAQDRAQVPAFAPFDAAGSPPAIDLPQTAGVPIPAMPQAKASTSSSAKPENTIVPVQAAPPPEKSAAPVASRPTATPTIPASAGTPRYTPGMSISGKASVVDGSVLVVGGNAIRLDGVDAPGLGQDCMTAEGLPWRCGATAKRTLAAVAEGERVACSVTEQSGDGAAAACSVRGIPDLARFMVESGFAVPNAHGRSRYESVAASARASRSGLWTGTFEAPWTWRLRHR